jgi:hypothetical protein
MSTAFMIVTLHIVWHLAAVLLAPSAVVVVGLAVSVSI